MVDLIGINGYYSFLSMVMNSAQTPSTGYLLTLCFLHKLSLLFGRA